MGKRKRRADLNKTPSPPPPPPPPPPDENPQSSQNDSHSEQKAYQQTKYSETKPSSSSMDSIGDSVQVSQAEPSPAHQHHNCSRAIVLKHPRPSYNRHYSRRSSCNYGEASTSHGKGTYLRDEKLSFKLSTKPYLDSGRFTDSRDRLFRKPEKIRDCLFANDASLSDAMTMVCAVCQKLLRKKPYILDSPTSSSDLSVVAVLVCGHVYHADCLDQRTSQEDRQDPPCPLCAHQLSDADASMVPE